MESVVYIYTVYLWKAYYQILSIILLKGFIKIGVKEGIAVKKKKMETSGIKYNNCECFLECINIKDDLIEYKCWYCNKNYQKRMVKITKRICQYIQIRLNTHKKNLLRFWNKRFRWMEWYTVINWRV